MGTGSPSNNQLDPSNQRADYGIGNNDVRNRFVANAVYEPSFGVTGYWKYLANGWTLAPIFQAQSGLPITGSVGGTCCGSGSQIAFGSGPMGTGVGRLPGFRNTYNYPRAFVFDTALSKKIPITERTNVELVGEAFNVLNHVRHHWRRHHALHGRCTPAAPTLTYSIALAPTTTPTPTSSTTRARSRLVRALTSKTLQSRLNAAASAAAFVFAHALCNASGRLLFC